MLPKVAVVIINYNGRIFLEKFLPSVVSGTYGNQEIIVADNASTDDSVSFLRAQYPQVRIILLERNHGYAGGYNQALKQVTADYYVLLNSDVEVMPGWIEPIVALMEADPGIGACQPKILSYHHKDQFEYAGAAGGWIDSLGYPFARGRVFDFCEKDLGQYDDASSIFWASGASLFVRGHLFHTAGGFDEYFFAHMEEIDFCWRLQLLGYTIYACPASTVYHVGGGTLPKGNPRKVFLNFRNNLIMLGKNLPKRQSFWKLPLRFVLDSVSAWKSLLSGEAVYFGSIITAHLAFAKWVLFKQGMSVFPKKRKATLTGWFPDSVIWLHFIRGKKTFAEIVRRKS